ncbi:protein O-GlcNAcase [Gammaproteobacteria bacterium]|nr:protein O-GlcNAcase [Gammaproteobacteria bacterium]
MLKGYIEGYYGRFFSEQDRCKVLDHMGKLNMDFYLYGPKEDSFHRVNWEKPYPDLEIKTLKSFIKDSKKNSVTPVFALSPGMNITKFSIKYINSLTKKIVQAKKIGFKDFAILFDDIDQARNTELAEIHLKIIQHVSSIKGINKNPLMICPTVYCKSFARGEIKDNEYLQVLAANIDPNINILWTGDEVVSESISIKNLKDLKSLFKNPIIIWDNFYANDYCPTRFFIGPYKGRASLDKVVEGIGINPTGMPITDSICLERFVSPKTNQQIFNSYNIPKNFKFILPYFLDPFKRHQNLTAKKIDKLLSTQNELCIEWKSELQLEWAPFLWNFYLDLILLKKINDGQSEFSLEEWLKRRYSDPLTRTILRK